jgi:hypothetical protein
VGLQPNNLTVSKVIRSGYIALLTYCEQTFSIGTTHLGANELNDAISHIKSTDMFNYLLNNRIVRLCLNTRTTEKANSICFVINTQ